MRAFILLLVLLTWNACAGTTNWTGATNSDWNTGANWDNGVPGSGDIANVGATANPPVVNTASLSVATLNLNNTTLTINATFTLTVNTTATFNGGTATVAGLGTLALPANSTIQSGTLISTGNISGTLNISGQSFELNGNGTQTAALNLILNATSTLRGNNAMPAVAAGGALTITANTGTQVDLLTNFRCDGTLNVNASGTGGLNLNISGVTMTVNGVMNLNASGANAASASNANLTIGATGVLNVNSTAAGSCGISATLSNSGALNVLSNTLNLSGTTTSSGTITATNPGTLLNKPAGDLTSSGNIAGNVRFSGPRLKLTGNGTQVGTINLTLGATSGLEGAGADPALAAAGVINLSPAGGTQLDVFNNFRCDGTFNVNATAANGMSVNLAGITMTVNGTLNLTAFNANPANITNATGVLSVAGGAALNVNSTATGSCGISSQLTNAGTMTVVSNTLTLSGTTTSSGSIIASNTGALLNKPAGDLTSSGNIAGNLNFSGPRLKLTGNGTQVGTINLSLGATSGLEGAGADPALAAAGVINLSPAGGTQLDVFTDFRCDGTFNVNAAAANMNVNLALVTMTVNGVLNLNASATNACGTSNAGGILSVAAGGALNVNSTAAGTCYVASQFVNAGATTVVSNTFNLSGTTTSSGTITASNTGVLIFKSAADLTSTGNIAGNLRFNGSRLKLTGSGTQTGTINLSLNATSGLEGAGANAALAATGVINLSPAGGTQLDVFTNFRCDGTFNVNAAAGSMNVNLSGVTMTVNGVLNLNASSTHAAGTSNAGGILSVAAGGALNVNSTAAGTCFVASQFVNAGTVTVVSNTFDLSGTTTSSGTITASGGGVLIFKSAADLTSTGNINGNLRLNGARLKLTGNATQTGTINLSLAVTSGLEGAGINPALAAGGVINLSPAGGNQLDVFTDFRCDGTFNVNAGASNMNVNLSGVTMTVNGVLNLTATATTAAGTSNAGGVLSVTASGALNVNSTAGGTCYVASQFVNAGTVTVVSNTFDLSGTTTSSGTINASNAGALVFKSAADLTSTGNIIGNLKFNGSRLKLNGSGTQTGTINLTLSVTSGLEGNAVNPAIAASGVLNIAPTGGTQLDLFTNFRNDGSLNVNASATQSINFNISGVTLTNNGTVRLQGNGAQTANIGNAAFVNSASGTVTNSAGSNQNTISAAFTSAGTVESTAGVLQIPAPFSTAGIMRVAGGATLKMSGAGTATINAGGLLTGAGTLNGSVVNSGTVTPGTTTGALNITGNYTQNPSGVLTIEVGGTTAGSTYDQLAITGSATLGGTLNATLVGGFLPAANFVFSNVLSYASLAGDFATFNGINTSAYFLRTTVATNTSLQAKLNPSTPGGAMTMTQQTVLNNTLPGTNANGEPLTFSIVSAPANGTLTITNATTGAFTYTPNASFFGFETLTYRATDGRVFSTAGTLTITVLPKDLPRVLVINVSQNPTRTGLVPTFTATVNDPNNLPLTVTWDFGDGTPKVTGTTVTHAFTGENIFTVTATAANFLVNGSASIPMQVFAPNSGAEGVKNISDGRTPVTNPLDGLSISVLSSNGGVIELFVDANSLLRAEVDLLTSFEGIPGRTSTGRGPRPVAKFAIPSVYVAVSTATDPATGQVRGKGRKTIAISRAETGFTPLFKTAASSNAVTGVMIKGSFSFGRNLAASAPRADTVTLNGSFELPEGVDLSQPQELAIGVGNILDSVTVDAKGKAKLPSTKSLIKKLQIRYPRVKRAKGAATLTGPGTKATFSLTLSGSDFSANGFDTEGIAPVPLISENAKAQKSIPRSIQIAGVFAGASFEATTPVQFKVSAGNDSGTISGRAAKGE